MKVIELFVENVKRIKAISIRPRSDVVRINGDNGSGKTSTLDSILWALGGATNISMVPIRQGEEQGIIRLDLGEFIVTRTFSAAGATKLTVQSRDGAHFPKPQKKLDELFGSLSLDPLEFQRMSAKDRMLTLRSIVRLDVDVDALDAQNAQDFEKRAEVNRDAKGLEERVHLYAGGLSPNADTTPIDTKALLDQMEDAARVNAAGERELTQRVGAKGKIEQRQRRAVQLREQAQSLILQAKSLNVDADNEDLMATEDTRLLLALPAIPDPIDVSTVRRQLQDADRENTVRAQQRTQRENYLASDAQLQTALARAKQLTAQIDYRIQKKSEAIGAATFPVPGLSFSPDGVLFKGLPFDQASGAEQLHVSFAIAAAMRPALPVVLIKDGSLLDDNSMVQLEELAAQYGAQVWIERVGADDVGIVLEEGEVITVDGVAIESQQVGATA